jgi:hypothetical protein
MRMNNKDLIEKHCKCGVKIWNSQERCVECERVRINSPFDLIEQMAKAKVITKQEK